MRELELAYVEAKKLQDNLYVMMCMARTKNSADYRMLRNEYLESKWLVHQLEVKLYGE